MRRSGSSSCMLLPKSSVSSLNSLRSVGGDGSSEGQKQQQLSVTVINTQTLPSYSTERFYMLSEIELHGPTTKFLCDYTDDGDCDATLDTMTSLEDQQQTSASTNLQQHNHRPVSSSPSFVILYLLWKPNTYAHAKDFVDCVVDGAVQKLLSILGPQSSASNDDGEEQEADETKEEAEAATTKDRENYTNTKIYLVVEKLIPAEVFSASLSKEEEEEEKQENDASSSTEENSQNKNDDPTPVADTSNHSNSSHHDRQREQQRQRLYQVQVRIAESLTRQVATSPKFRSVLDGITVGLTDQFQAAPGLEACMNAILYGAKERRKASVGSNDNKQSSIGIFCEHPDDLLGIQEDNTVNMETDAVQGVLQSRSCAEWNGNGNIHSFASRAHEIWHKKHGIPYPPSSPSRDSIKSNKRPLRRSGGGSSGRQRRKNQAKSSSSNTENDPNLDASEQLATIMVWIFWAIVTSILWKTYGDDVKNILTAIAGDA